MADDTANPADPSMEEILASIRKIISDDAPPVEAAPEPEPEPQPEEVVELTQEIQEDGSVVDVKAPEEPVAPPEPPPAPEPIAPPEPVAPPEPIAPSEPLVSEPVADTAASTFSSLANTVEIDRLSAGMGGATFLGNGNRTLEDMVIELMRPLLKEWLDKNLPATVDRLVQKEIDRISHRS